MTFRQELEKMLDEVRRKMATRVLSEASDFFVAYPYPELKNEDRAENMVNHEIFKLANRRKLKLDGGKRGRDRAKQQAVGQCCHLCGKSMGPEEETECHHQFYDGRPTIIVHKSCHKEHQPH